MGDFLKGILGGSSITEITWSSDPGTHVREDFYGMSLSSSLSYSLGPFFSDKILKILICLKIDLSLNVKKCYTLEEALKQFCELETIEARNVGTPVADGPEVSQEFEMTVFFFFLMLPALPLSPFFFLLTFFSIF
jgi:hypothetical protein